VTMPAQRAGGRETADPRSNHRDANRPCHVANTKPPSQTDTYRALAPA
jgi:hypothetical protein